MRKLLIGFTVATMSFANISHADFTFYSDTNVCNEVTGNWTGSGKASNWLIGTCVYNGSATVSNVDSSGRFTLDVTANKRSGSPVCPEHHSTRLSAVCVNGAVTVKTEYGNLRGNFSTSTGNAKGTLEVSPGLDVDISIQFRRAG